MFFSEESNMKVIRSFLRDADVAGLDDRIQAERLRTSKKIIGYIHKFPQGWDDRCQFNIKHIGDQFIQALASFDAAKKTDVDHIYSMSYRFLCEFDFLVGSGKELAMELNVIKNKIQLDAAEMDDLVRSQIIYASYVMPANIAKDFINDANISVFKDFENKISEAFDLKKKWDEEVAAKNTIVNNLKDKLETYAIGFNFVGLYDGFLHLLKKKEKERGWLFVFLVFMGLLMVVPLVCELIFMYRELNSPDLLKINHLIVAIPLISLELVLIYFFRVILLNHRSVKGQIIQIELRQTLCQFVQSYAEYASKLKKDGEVVLDKFENIIFSGILSEPDKIPGTFDGLEQLVGFIKSVKS